MSDDKKSLCRVIHNKNYTVVNNTICNEKGISFKAKGIWLYAFSRPDDWKFYLCDIVNQSTEGKDSVSAGLKELEKFGYLVKEKRTDERNRFIGWTYTFYETPVEIQKKFPKREIPDVGKLRTRENPPLLSTESLLNTKKQQQAPIGAKVCDAVVAIYKCIEKIGLTEKEKKSLMKYPEEEVKDAVAFATHESTKIKTSLIRTIIWALKEKPMIPDIVDKAKNREDADACEGCLDSKNWILEALSEKVMIYSKNPNNTKVYEICYDNVRFKENLDKLLKECGFKLCTRRS